MKCRLPLESGMQPASLTSMSRYVKPPRARHSYGSDSTSTTISMSKSPFMSIRGCAADIPALGAAAQLNSKS